MPNAFRDIAHALAALTTHCGDFRDAWNDASSSEGFVGRWTGEWRSEENGHHGPMDCVLSSINDTQVQAFFHAEYLKYLRVCYRVDLKLEPADTGFEVQGETDLGRLAGGVYQYSGHLTETEWTCHYRCAYDHGTFELKRVIQAE